MKQLEEQLGNRRKVTELQSLNLLFKGDLTRFQYSYFGYVLTLYQAYHSSGVLPFPGSLADQPAQTMEIINTLDALRGEEEQRIQEETQRQTKREKNVRR